ncbi:hypothetical protein JB92DRAFT_2634808, partial [Gautieria morchelliformis]
RPSSGLHFAMGFLQQHGLCIRKEHIRGSMKHLDSLGQALQRHDTIMHHTY